MSDYVIGIDLGTTNSCLGIWRNGKADIIPDSQGNRIIPFMFHLQMNKD